MWYKYRNWKNALLSFGLIYLLFLVVLFLFFIAQANSLQTSIEASVKSDLKAYSTNIDNKVAMVASDVILLEELVKNRDSFNLVAGEAEFISPSHRVSLEEDFYAWLNINTEYDQLRIISNSGMELIRVNYNNGEPLVVSGPDLQNKGDRYYFINSINLTDESIYMSELDLNKENGEIEYIDGEPKPMLRIASPIYNDDSNQIGLLIVNYLADNLFNDAETRIGDYVEFEVINDEGYYIHSTNEDIEFGFMFPDKLDETFSKYHGYNIFDDSDTTISQNVFEGELYTSLLITNIKMSDAISIFVGQETPVYSDNGDILLFGEVDIRTTSDFVKMLNSYFIFIGIAFVFAIILSRLLDELNYSRKERIASLEYNSKYDSLTGIPNRSNVYEYIEKLNQQKEVYTVLFLDLDDFKSVNDKFGHAIGDDVLKDSAKRINNIIRQTDMLARMGGDEFILVLARLNDQVAIDSIINKIKTTIKSPFIYDEIECKIGVSIGIAIQDGSLSTEDILFLADERMYTDKKQNKQPK